VVWAKYDAAESNIVDDEQRRIYRLQRDAQLSRERRQSLINLLNRAERDPEYAAAFAAEAARHGDNDVPEALKKPQPMSDMARIYSSSFPDSQWYDPNVEQPVFSRLQLRDKPVLSDEQTREGGGFRLRAEASPQPAQPAPNKDLLSPQALSRKFLSKEYWIPEKTEVASKTVALPARTTW
jgi:hypothetical protein